MRFLAATVVTVAYLVALLGPPLADARGAAIDPTGDVEYDASGLYGEDDADSPWGDDDYGDGAEAAEYGDYFGEHEDHAGHHAHGGEDFDGYDAMEEGGDDAWGDGEEMGDFAERPELPISLNCDSADAEEGEDEGEGPPPEFVRRPAFLCVSAAGALLSTH